MAIKITSGTDTFDANVANETYVMSAGALLATDPGEDGIDAVSTVGGRTFRIDGIVDAGRFGIALENDALAAADRIFIGVNGVLAGTDRAINANEGHVQVNNKGQLKAVDSFVVDADCVRFVMRNSGVVEGLNSNTLSLNNDFTSLGNSGSILATTTLAVALTGEFELVNSGLIQSTDFNAVRLGLAGETTGRIINSGTIISGADAISATFNASDIKIVNRGDIFGDINMFSAEGVTVIDNTAGRIVGNIDGSAEIDKLLLHKASIVTGQVSGGAGDDIYVVSNPNIIIVEGGGTNNDTVRSLVSFSFENRANFETLVLLGTGNIDATGNGKNNTLTGNVGNNELAGAIGEDTLRGGKGNDKLTGGVEADTFVYKTGDGKDTVTDFTAEDFIDLSDVGAITSVNDLFRNHIFADGDDVVIKIGASDSIRLKDVVEGDLDEGQFIV